MARIPDPSRREIDEPLARARGLAADVNRYASSYNALFSFIFLNLVRSVEVLPELASAKSVVPVVAPTPRLNTNRFASRAMVSFILKPGRAQVRWRARLSSRFERFKAELTETLRGGLPCFGLFGGSGQGFFEQLLFAQWGEAGEISVEALS